MSAERLRGGARVHHATYGPGSVRAVLDGGRTALVAFDARPQAPLLLLARGLELTGDPPRPLERLTLREPPPPPPPEPVWAPVDRQALEALRLGVVPSRGLERLTVGREEERARLDALLDAGRGLLVLSGGYGSGKSHLLELAWATASERGHLVGRATFDPVEVPPSHPLRLYRAVVEGLRYPEGTGGGLRPLLERVADRDSHVAPGGEAFHRWLSPVAWALRHAPEGLLVDALFDWVEGRSRETAAGLSDMLARRGWSGPRLLALPDYRTFGQVMAHLLGGVAAWSADVGLGGLVVLLDEAEYLDALVATSREMAENVLKYLALATLPDDVLTFRPESVYRGGQAIHRAVEPVFREGQPLVVVCAFTPHPVIDVALRRIARERVIRVDLDPLPARLFPVLSDRVLAMVREIHPEVDPPPEHRHLLRTALRNGFDRGEIETTRQAARLCVEYWDLYRDSPDRAARALNP